MERHSQHDFLKKDILIYADEGSSVCSYQAAARACLRLCAEYSTSLVSAQVLNTTPWEQDARLLIMPGGRATPYYQLLSDKGVLGNQKIREFVANGGSYLGLCAGAYYAAHKIIFEKNHPINEIITENTLNLFSGVAEGPAYDLGVYDYEGEAGMRPAKLQGSMGEFDAYFNGGCFFHGLGLDSRLRGNDVEGRGNGVEDGKAGEGVTPQILASYADFESRPAIITFSYGLGRVCLSGVHMEYHEKFSDILNYLLTKKSV